MVVCCGAALTRQVHLNHHEIAHARIVSKLCKECNLPNVIEAGCYRQTFEIPNVHLMHAFKRFLKQIKRFNYPIYKTGYSRSASRPTSVFGPPHMCVWDEIIEQYKRAGGRLEQEGEMDTLATPCHETETLSVSRYYAQYAPNASAGIEELRPNPKLLERAIETLKDCDPPRNLESVVPSPTPPPRFVEMLPPPPAVFQYSIDLGGGHTISCPLNMGLP